MVILCAWCGKQLPSSGTPSVDEKGSAGPLLHSHGICDQCSQSLIAAEGRPLQEFLDSLGFPVTLVSGNVEVVAANTAARILAGKDDEDLAGRLLGEVFECVYSHRPGGCGRTIHCSGCAIRRTVTATYRTGLAHRRVPATFTCGREEAALTHDFYISTEKVDDRVLLFFDFPSEGS